jgi:lysophospholipase L1-like esterase
MKRIAVALLLSLTACRTKHKPTIVLLGDSITWGEEPICKHDRYSKPVTHFLKKTLKVALNKEACSKQFDISEALPQYDFIVMGYHDARSDQLLIDTRKTPQIMHEEDHVSEAITSHPDLIVLLIGTNDLRQHVPAETVLANIDKIRQRVSAAGIKLKIASVPLGKGFDVEQLSKLNANLHPEIDYYSATERDGMQLPGMFLDGIHPSPEGYRAMLPDLRRALAGDLNY